jgi:hypothetical protein
VQKLSFFSIFLKKKKHSFLHEELEENLYNYLLLSSTFFYEKITFFGTSDDFFAVNSDFFD